MTSQTKSRRLRLAALLLSTSALAGAPLGAAWAQPVWTGGASTDWTASGNWSTGAAPTSADDVLIDTNTPNATTLDGTTGAANILTIGQAGSGSLSVINHGALTASEVDIALNGGSGSLTISGGSTLTLSTGNKTISLGGNGIGNMLIASSAIVNDTTTYVGSGGAFSTLTIDAATLNTANLYLGTENSEGAVVVQNGGSLVSSVSILGGLTQGGQGNATVTGMGSNWNAGALQLGSNGSGTATIQNDGALTTTNIVVGGSTSTSLVPDSGTLAIASGGVATTNGAATVGQGAGNTGAVTVDGATSAWNVTTNPLLIGDLGGTGSLSLTAGGAATAGGGITLGTTSGSTGTVTVDGAGSLLTAFGTTVVGSSGAGTLTLQNNGQMTGATISIADQAGSTGAMTVTGPGSKATLTTTLSVGSGGVGNLSILAGGAVQSVSGFVGFANGSNGTALVDGTNSTWTNTGTLSIANFAGSTGSLTISNGGAVTDNVGQVGTAGVGTVTVTGAGSHWTNNGDATFGLTGNGTVMVQAGGLVTDNSNTYVGRDQGFVGTLTVDGALSKLVSANVLYVGGDQANAEIGVGQVNVTHGGEIDTSEARIGDTAASIGTVVVDAGTFSASSDILVGRFGTGSLTVSNGGSLTAASIGLGDQPGSNGTLTLTGAGTTATIGAGGSVLVGNVGVGTLSILAGATLTAPGGGIAFTNGVTSTATVDGAGSSWTSTGNLIVGSIGTGNLTVSGGGAVSGGTVFIGGSVGSGSVLVTGVNSVLASTTGSLVDGSQGNGALTVQNDGTVSAPAGIMVAQFGSSSSSLTIGGDGAPAAPGTLDTPTVTFGTGSGSLSFNHTSGNYVFAPVLSGAGSVANYAGVTRFTGASPGFTGVLDVFGGTVLMDGSIAAPVGVEAGGSLGGAGSIANSVNVSGSLIGVQGQTLTMNSLTMTNTAQINVSLSSPGGAALFAVNQDLALNGTLNVTAAGGAGVYRLINYGGVLSGGGLAIGATPFGTAAGDFSVQTSVPGQVNLLAQVDSPTAPTMVFWDGGASGSANNHSIDGGSGIWSTTSTTWTDSAGASNGPMPAGALAIFEGHPGTVTVDGSGGPVGVTGIQFANDGFVVAGDPLTLNGQATIRVGDGTAAGAGYTATISAPLTGSGGLTKTDLGTLNLTGINDYTGPTTVAAGRLAVNGTAANSVVTVQSGGILGGNGTVGGVVAQAGGTVAPGNSIGKLTVAGNYAQAAGSIFEVQLTSTGQADRIDVSGTATLASGAGLKVIKTDAAPYVPGTRYTVLTAAGGLTGTYALSGDLTAFYGLTAHYDAHDVFLDVVKIASFSSVAATHNQRATAGVLDGLASDSALATAMGNEPDEVSARKAFDMLSGEVHATVKSALIEDGRFVRDAALGRIRSAFGAAGASTAPGVTYDDKGNPIEVAADARQPVFWGQGFGSWGSLDGDGNAGAARTADSGLFLGGDAPVGPTGTWRMGVLGGYSRTNLDVGPRASIASSDNYHLGVYGGGTLGAIGLRAGAAYAWRDIRATRSVSLPGVNNELTSSYASGGAQVFGEAGYRIDLTRVSLEPYAAAAYTNLRTDGFTERGGITALTGKADTTDVTFTTLGLRGSTLVNVNAAAVTLRGGVGWRHAFGDVVPASETAFAGSSVFSAQGVPIARDTVALDAGFDVSVAANVSAGLSYTGQVAAHARDNGLKANVSWRF